MNKQIWTASGIYYGPPQPPLLLGTPICDKYYCLALHVRISEAAIQAILHTSSKESIFNIMRDFIRSILKMLSLLLVCRRARRASSILCAISSDQYALGPDCHEDHIQRVIFRQCPLPRGCQRMGTIGGMAASTASTNTVASMCHYQDQGKSD